MPYVPIIPEGEHLGTSHAVDGAVTGHLFEDGTNKLTGHASWRWVDDDDPDDDEYDYTPPASHEDAPELTQEELDLAAQLAAVIVLVLIGAGIAAAPHLKRWWSETVVPAAKSAWKRATTTLTPKLLSTSVRAAKKEPRRFVASASGVELAVAQSPITMSRAEWTARLRAMLAADLFRKEQQRVLSNALVVDHASLDHRSDSELLSPQQVAGDIVQMLEANRSLLTAETTHELIKVLDAELARTRQVGATPE